MRSFGSARRSIRHLARSKTRMRDREERRARGVDAQCARPETDQREAMRGEQGQLEAVPATFRSDGEQHALAPALGQHGTDRRGTARIGDEPNAVAKQAIEMILDENPELPVDGDPRRPRVARLLQPLDQQRTIGRFGDEVGIEVVPLYALGIGQDDLPDAKRRELRPQPTDDFRARQGKQNVDARARRSGPLEHAAQCHAAIVHGFDGPDAEWAIEQPEANCLTGCDTQHVHQVSRARIGESDARRVEAIVLVEENQVHVWCVSIDSYWSQFTTWLSSA